MLRVLGFSDDFRNWVYACVAYPRFSVALNGGLVGYFSGAKGVWQGDPLSPYLFILLMNVLSDLLNLAGRYKIFNYHPKFKKLQFFFLGQKKKKKKLQLAHLCFVDDLLVFAKRSSESRLAIGNILDFFCKISGLKVNFLKSELFSSGVCQADLQSIVEHTGLKLRRLPVRYLGVPLVTRNLRINVCGPLIEKITRCIHSWTS